MTIVQTYIMTAVEGREAARDDLLRRLADSLRAVEGCEAVTVLREVKRPTRYVFMETYADAAAHEASAAHVPKPMLTEMVALLAGKPDVMTLSPALA